MLVSQCYIGACDYHSDLDATAVSPAVEATTGSESRSRLVTAGPPLVKSWRTLHTALRCSLAQRSHTSWSVSHLCGLQVGNRRRPTCLKLLGLAWSPQLPPASPQRLTDKLTTTWPLKVFSLRTLKTELRDVTLDNSTRQKAWKAFKASPR